MDPALLFSDELMMSGYEDWTIARFEQDTDIDIPVADDDPVRFRKRYDWLQRNALEKWIDWRCAQYTDLWSRIRDRLLETAPDAKVHLVLGEPSMSRRAGKMMDGGYENPAARGSDILRQFGFDIETLKREPGITVAYTYAVTGSGQALHSSGGWRALQRDPDWQNLFADDSKGGAFLKVNLTHHGAFCYPEGRWVFTKNLTRQCYLWSPRVAESFVNVMARSNPAWLPHTWMDVTESMGHIHELRLFARAYRTLPNGEYKRLTGDGLDRNVWISYTAAEDADYVYAANLHWWELDVTLDFARGSDVHDLIRDEPVRLQDHAWRFRLAPYEIQTFRVTGPKRGSQAGLRSAEADPVLSESERAHVEDSIERELKRAEDLAETARVREDELSARPGLATLPSLEQSTAEARAFLKDGDTAGAYGMAAGGVLDVDIAYLAEHALQAMPMLLLGPFGDPDDTDIERWGRGNPEVVANFRGMETPYIGESDHPDCLEIISGFRPDITRAYRVYPQRDMRWQATLCTGELRFYPSAHSEMPYWMTGYAYTDIYSPDERDGMFRIGSVNALWLWVNDRLVIRYGGAGTPRYGQRAVVRDSTRAEVQFEAGWNRVLIKVLQRGPNSYSYIQVTDTAGKPMSDLRFRALPSS